MSTAILLIDTDLGFLFWLGSALDQGGYQAFPARSVPDAIQLLAELHLTVGAVILNCDLPGAEQLIVRMRHSRKNLKILALGEPGHPIPAGLDGLVPRPAQVTDESRAILLQRIRDFLSPRPSASGRQSATGGGSGSIG